MSVGGGLTGDTVEMEGVVEAVDWYVCELVVDPRLIGYGGP